MSEPAALLDTGQLTHLPMQCQVLAPRVLESGVWYFHSFWMSVGRPFQLWYYVSSVVLTCNVLGAVSVLGVSIPTPRVENGVVVGDGECFPGTTDCTACWCIACRMVLLSAPGAESACGDARVQRRPEQHGGVFRGLCSQLQHLPRSVWRPANLDEWQVSHSWPRKY